MKRRICMTYIYIVLAFVFLTTTRFFLEFTETEFSFVIENRDMTDFYLLYFTSLFPLR